MQMSKLGAFVFLLVCSFTSSGQVLESSVVLTSAPRLSLEIESTDTISPPFTDDFSYASDRPSSALWQDEKVWVNDQMALYQKSIGVATFDGLNEYGFAYKENALGSDSIADVLTSRFLNLLGLTDVYLSFQIQEGGWGELPSNTDSIVVEFWSPITSDWMQVWGQKGTGAASAFKSVIIPVQGSNYLNNGFRFRFAAYGARAGAYDIWNLDYVQLDKDRNPSDTLITEPSMARAHPLIMGSGLYTSWPWWVSNSSNVSNRPASLEFTYRRNGNIPPGGWSLNLGQFRWEENGALIQQVTTVPVVTNVQHNQDQTFVINVPAGALNNLTGPTTVNTKVWFDGTAAGTRSNDTVHGALTLDNYIAMDDGTAERAYAVQNVIGGRVAQKFKVVGLGSNDSLKGVRFNFVDAGLDYMSTFRIAIWAPSDSLNKPGSLLYISDTLYKPNKGYDRGDWIPYELDSSISLNAFSDVWIGYVCTSSDPMYLGLDVTRDVPGNLPRFYGDGFNWYESLESGVIMMRPYFNYSPADMSLMEDSPAYKVFPNPSLGSLRITGPAAEYTITDLAGVVISNGLVEEITSLELHGLKAGMYIIVLKTSDETSVFKWMKL
jgi:hypothetical protein